MNFLQMIRIFWKFCRPHTIIGTSIAVLTVYFLVTAHSHLFFQNLNLLVLAWISCVAVNIYVVGINQIADWKVDQVNKPFLPLASGELSKTMGWFMSLSMGLMALVSSYLQGMFLFIAVSFIFMIGTAYSVPGLYLKGRPVWACLAISVARGLTLILGSFLYFQKAIFGSIQISPSIFAFAFFNFCFGMVISLMKDAPDLAGDKLYGINTLTVRVGARAVFLLAVSIVTVAYVALSVAAAFSFSAVSALFLALSHGAILGLAWFRLLKLDYSKSEGLYSYYMLFWKFFYLEFGLFALVYAVQ